MKLVNLNGSFIFKYFLMKNIIIKHTCYKINYSKYFYNCKIFIN